MIDNAFRSQLPKFTKKIIKFYKFLNVTPNQITFIGLLISFCSAYLVVRQYFIAAILIWWLGRLFDGTDGIYARETNQNTAFGAFLDILFDMISYSIMIVAFDMTFPEFRMNWILILFLYVLCITSALSLGNLEDVKKISGKDNRGLRLAAGIAEGGETGIAYTIFLLFPAYILQLSQIWLGILILTIVARILLAHRELKP